MTTIETIAIIIALIITLPQLCKWIRMPSLLYCLYLVAGVALATAIPVYSRLMLNEVGKIGFTLLLFLIGLEIEIPSWNSIKKSLQFCSLWLGVQIPVVMLIISLFGFDTGYAWIAAAAINACSLSIAYGLLKSQNSRLQPETSKLILSSMITLEVLTLFIFASSDVVFKHGWGYEILTEGMALIGFVMVIKLFSKPIHFALSWLLEGKGKLRIHQLLLIIFLIAIVGERLGLSAAKTAFFLGLFMTAATNKGLKIEDELNPLAKGILVPVFFISLGSHISVINFSSLIYPISVIMITTLVIRYFIFQRCFGPDLPKKSFLLLYPNITMASVAAEILIQNKFSEEQVDLLLIISLVLTVGSAILFPSKLFKEKPVSDIVPADPVNI